MRPHRFKAKLVLISAVLAFTDVCFADHPSTGLGIGLGGPINTQSAIPLPKGKWSVGAGAEFIDFDAFSDEELVRFSEEDPEADIHSVDSVLEAAIAVSYGLAEDLSMGIRIPYVRRENIREAHGHGEEEEGEAVHAEETVEEEGVEVLGDADGLGDIILFGQYRFYHDQETNTHTSLLLGVKTPTGATDEKSNEGERLEAEFQPGSGSWDGLFGLAFSRDLQKVSLNASTLYKLVTEGSQDTDLGDVLSYNVGLSYRLSGNGDHQHAHDQQAHGHGSWDLILELNGEWRDKEERRGVTNPNSGGNWLFVSPGVRYSRDSGWAAALSVGAPIVTDLNGRQVEPNFRLIGSLAKSF